MAVAPHAARAQAQYVEAAVKQDRVGDYALFNGAMHSGPLFPTLFTY